MSEKAETRKPMTEKEVKEWAKKLIKEVWKLLNRHSNNMSDNNETIVVLLMFLEKYPMIFAHDFGMIERDMIKWSLKRNIEHNQKLVEKIEQIEKDFNLPLHGIDDCN